jgi:carboxynorspermidine decarboxylase
MPDVIEAPYRPALLGEAATGQAVKLGGPSCLAGDVIGDYHFDELPKAGQRVAFLDQAHYSMVKTSTFNGIALPSIAIWNSQTDALRMVRQFSYADFEGRLS